MKQKEAVVATERKGMSRSGVESAAKLVRVADGDQATKGKEVKMARCSQEFIDALLRLEEKPIRPLNFDFLDRVLLDRRKIVVLSHKKTSAAPSGKHTRYNR